MQTWISVTHTKRPRLPATALPMRSMSKRRPAGGRGDTERARPCPHRTVTPLSRCGEPADQWRFHNQSARLSHGQLALVVHIWIRPLEGGWTRHVPELADKWAHWRAHHARNPRADSGG